METAMQPREGETEVAIVLTAQEQLMVEIALARIKKREAQENGGGTRHKAA